MPEQTTQRRYGADKVALAQRLFQEFYTACFWHMRFDLVISEATVPLVINGLRKNGGLAAMQAAAQLDE